MPEESNVEQVTEAIEGEPVAVVVADAAKTEADALHDMLQAQNTRLDAIHTDLGTQFGRVHERLDQHDKALADLAELKAIAAREEAATESVQEAPAEAAELVVEAPKDVAKTEEKKRRGHKGKRRGR